MYCNTDFRIIKNDKYNLIYTVKKNPLCILKYYIIIKCYLEYNNNGFIKMYTVE